MGGLLYINILWSKDGFFLLKVVKNNLVAVCWGLETAVLLVFSVRYVSGWLQLTDITLRSVGLGGLSYARCLFQELIAAFSVFFPGSPL